MVDVISFFFVEITTVEGIFSAVESGLKLMQSERQVCMFLCGLTVFAQMVVIIS